ncbi:ciliary neurotrophic factor receptor subunit alpha-like [Lampetra planeri]
MNINYCREFTAMVLLALCLNRCVEPRLKICREKAGESDPSAVVTEAGTEVTLPCNTSSVQSGVLWRLNGSAVPPSVSHTLNAMGSITVEGTALSANGVYSCHNNVSGEQLINVTLEVGYPPERPNVSCRAINPHKVICKWTYGRETFLPIKFTVFVKSKDTDIKCIPKRRRNECSFAGKYNEPYPYAVTVVAKNALGCEGSETAKFSLKSILKPDPPIILKVIPGQGRQKHVWVICSYPSTWNHADKGFTLTAELEYKSMEEKNYRQIKIATSRENVWVFKILDSHPGTSRVIRVRAKDFLDYGRWSDWSSPTYVNTSNEDESKVNIPKKFNNAASTTIYIESSVESEPTQYPDALKKVYLHGGTSMISLFCIVLCSACLALTTLSVTASVYLKKRRKEDTRHQDAVARQELEPLAAPVILMNGDMTSTNPIHDTPPQDDVTRINLDESNPFLQVFGEPRLPINNNVINSEYFYKRMKTSFLFQETQV